MERTVGALLALTLALAACTHPATPSSTSVPEPVPEPRATAPPSPMSVVKDGRPRLGLFVDARPIPAGRCAPASVSIPEGRTRVRLQWRAGGARWSPWPAGPERPTRRGMTNLRLCPGWTAGPLEVRAIGDDARPSAASRVHTSGAPWMGDLERLIGDRAMSVSVMVDGAFVYGHLPGVRRAAGSNEKVLLSMALLDRFGPRARILTEAATRTRIRDGVVDGDLYLVGNGDPEVGADDIHRLALRLRAAGIRRIGGSIVADTSTFVRDRRAPGWHAIALRYIGLPTALSYQGNVDADGYVFDPERTAATALEAELRSLGVHIGAAPDDGDAPDDLRAIAVVRSDPLAEILRRQNVSSINLDAETLSKMLATEVLGRPGSIAAGAGLIERWANDLEAGVTLHDASGLSYRNRVSTAALAALLDDATARPWGDALMASLPAPGEGTLAGRLGGLEVRAKTGTLIHDVSALSGYVRLRDGAWASFSIISALPKGEAVALEEAIVRTVAART